MHKLQITYEQLLETIQEGIWVYDADSNTTYVNPKMAEILGYEVEEMIGKSIFDFLNQEVIKNIEKKVERRKSGISETYEEKLKHKEGHDVCVEIKVTPIIDEEGIFNGGIAGFTDITDRKKAEEASRNSEQELRTITQNMTDVVAMADVEGRFTYISQSSYAVFGYKPEELIGKSIIELVHDDDTLIVGTTFQEGITEGKKSASVEHRVRKKNGSYIWVEAIGNLIIDDNGQPSGVLLVSRDISERKQAEEQIKRLAQIADSAPSSIIIHDYEGNIKYANEQTFQMNGYEKEEFMKLNLRDIDVPESAELITARIQEIEEKGVAEFEVRHFRKDGSTFPLRVHAKQTEWFGEPAILGILTDISERKKAEEALRVSEEKYRQITENISDVVWITDAELNTVYISPSVEKLLGESVDDHMSRSLEERLPPNSLNNLLHTFHEEMEKEKDPLNDKNRTRVIEVQCYKADGSIIWISMHISATRDKDGNITGFQGVTRDITDRKKAEEALRLQASERAAVDTFTYSVSNDLKAPLRRIEGFSEALLEECPDQLNDQARDYLNRIVTQIGSMKNLTDALLQLSRVVSREIDRETVDLSALIRANLEKLHYEEKKRRIETVVAPELIVEGDAELLNLMLTNLLDNAWKFTSGVEEARIEFGSKEQDGRTVYFLKDNGVGFDMSHAEKLLAPFQKLHSDEDYPGIGIGLNLVYRIISLHGGEIWAEGKVGEGACFFFALPQPGLHLKRD